MRRLFLLFFLVLLPAFAQNNVSVYVRAEMGSTFSGGSIVAQQIIPQGNGTPSLTFFFDSSGNANGPNGMGLPGTGTWQFRFCTTTGLCYNAEASFPGVPVFDITTIFTNAIASGGGGGTPGGGNGDIQINNGGIFGSGGPGSGHTANVGPLGNIAVKPPAAASIQYADVTNGLDSNDGLSIGTAKKYIDTAICSLPGGTCPGQAGQGIVYFTSGTLANAASPPGIWLACTGDPNFSSLPTGWMKGPSGTQGLQIEGIPTLNSGPQSTIPKALLGGNASIEVSACSSAINFKNMSIAYPAIDIQLGQCSDGTTRTNQCNASNIHFDNVAGNVNNLTGNGPAVDITGASFDINFVDSSFEGNTAASPSSDQAQPVIIDGRNNSGLGDITFNRGTMGNGGIRMYPGTGILLNVDVQDIVQEGSFGEPLVHIVNDGLSIYPVVTVINCQVADPAASLIPCVTVDPGLNGSGVKVTGAFGQEVNVLGPLNTDTQYGPTLTIQTVSPASQGQTGFVNNHVFGQLDDLWRVFAPTAVRYQNIAATSPSSWSGTYGGAVSTITAGQTSPDGLANAGLISYSSGSGNTSYASFYLNGNVPLTLGDYYAWTAVIRFGHKQRLHQFSDSVHTQWRRIRQWGPVQRQHQHSELGKSCAVHIGGWRT